MKKLLHERLRDEEAIYEGYITTDSGRRITALYKSEMEALAEEIEKYYIPRPRFEDGEPVQFGDEYKWADANIRKITGFGVTENGAPYVTCAFDGLGMSDAMIYSGSLKRPKPKVLDADGVEIKVGDTVWSLNDSTKWKVTETHPTEPRISLRQLDTEKEVEGGWFLSSEYSLREPDSLEKVQDTIDALANVYESDDRLCDDLHNISDRLTAIMERDA